MNDELRKTFAEGFTPEELEAGKKGFLQARQLSRSSDAAVSGRLVAYLVLGRTFAWDADLERKVAALTPQQVLEAMRRHIDPAKLSVVKAGDFSSLASNPRGPARAD
jgi:zinc protease